MGSGNNEHHIRRVCKATRLRGTPVALEGRAVSSEQGRKAQGSRSAFPLWWPKRRGSPGDAEGEQEQTHSHSLPRFHVFLTLGAHGRRE